MWVLPTEICRPHPPKKPPPPPLPQTHIRSLSNCDRLREDEEDEDPGSLPGPGGLPGPAVRKRSGRKRGKPVSGAGLWGGYRVQKGGLRWARRLHMKTPTGLRPSDPLESCITARRLLPLSADRTDETDSLFCFFILQTIVFNRFVTYNLFINVFFLLFFLSRSFSICVDGYIVYFGTLQPSLYNSCLLVLRLHGPGVVTDGSECVSTRVCVCVCVSTCVCVCVHVRTRAGESLLSTTYKWFICAECERGCFLLTPVSVCARAVVTLIGLCEHMCVNPHPHHPPPSKWHCRDGRARRHR